MASFVVRRLGFDGNDTPGLPYGQKLSAVIFADTAVDARAFGAQQLGVSPSDVEVIPWASNSDPEGLVTSLQEEG